MLIIWLLVCSQGGEAAVSDFVSGIAQITMPISYNDNKYFRIASIGRSGTNQNATAGCATLTSSKFSIVVNGSVAYSVEWISIGW